MLGKTGTISGSTTGLLSGLLEVVSGGDRTVDYIEDQTTLANGTGFIGGAAGDFRDGEVECLMEYNATTKSVYATLFALAKTATGGTTETWTITPPTSSTKTFVGYCSHCSGIAMRRNEHMTFSVRFQPTAEAAYSD